MSNRKEKVGFTPSTASVARLLDRLEEHEDRFKILEAKIHRLIANANSGPKGVVV